MQEIEMNNAECQFCKHVIQVGESPKLGDTFHCKNCGNRSMIMWLNPVELDFAYDYEGESYIYGDEDYYDFYEG